MIALLAICTHICPQAVVDESIAKTIREKHGSHLSSKDSYNDLLVHCAPKFVSPAVPNFCETTVSAENAYNVQLSLLDQELSCQAAFRKLRSYLKLYTSLPVSKLTSFGSVDEMLLLSLKLKFRQLESNSMAVPSSREASYKSALDIHYYLEDNTVHVDEAEKQRRFENYFMTQISQNYDIRKDVQAISTSL
jgi:translation initiation factor 3 subunit L